MSGVREYRWWDVNNVYRYRNDNLERMGFRSYRAYLKSELWKSIRSRVLGEKPICEACAKRKATQVHHRSYDPATLKGENVNSLSAICSRCHRKGERPFDKLQHSSDRMERAGKVAVKRHKVAAARVKQGQTEIKPEKPFTPFKRKPQKWYEIAPKRQTFRKPALVTIPAPRLVKA